MHLIMIFATHDIHNEICFSLPRGHFADFDCKVVEMVLMIKGEVGQKSGKRVKNSRNKNQTANSGQQLL